MLTLILSTVIMPLITLVTPGALAILGWRLGAQHAPGESNSRNYLVLATLLFGLGCIALLAGWPDVRADLGHYVVVALAKVATFGVLVACAAFLWRAGSTARIKHRILETAAILVLTFAVLGGQLVALTLLQVTLGEVMD